jgi:hypothetical protein
MVKSLVIVWCQLIGLKQLFEREESVVVSVDMERDVLC